MPVDYQTLGLAVLAAATIGLSKGGLPIASMFAVPILAIAIHPVTAAATLLPVLLASDLVSLLAYARHAERPLLAVLMPAMLAGIAFGWLSAAWMPVPMIMLVIGLIGIGYCAKSLLLRRPPAAAPGTKGGVFWGILSGFSSFISHSGGAPYQVFMSSRPIDKLSYAGTSAIVFASMNVVKLLPYWSLGAFDVGNWQLSLLLVPVGFIFTLIGIALLKVASEDAFRKVLDLALLAISLKLVWDGLTKYISAV